MGNKLITSDGIIERKSWWTRLWCPHSWTSGDNTYATLLGEKQYTCFMCGKQIIRKNPPLSWIIS